MADQSKLSPPRARLLAAAVAACFAQPAFALPTAPQVANGSASFSQAGNVLTVTNSNGAIINWNSFSIGAGETTRFVQPSSASSVMNRVVTADPSVLLGTMSSNGRVWLINPAGILVGQGARIDVAGFVASTLSVRNEDFLAGRFNGQATPGAGSVQNYGSISTPAGGSVYLVAPNVENHGIIQTPQGETILAAGQTVNLIDTATPGVKVEITGGEGNATNLGTILAESGRIGMAGVLVKNSGALNASSVVAEGGRIFLKATQDTLVDGGRLSATGTRGGRVEMLGNRVAVTGAAAVDASGEAGGGTVLLGGDRQGGNPDVQNARVAYLGPEASIRADAIGAGDGGKVIVWADDTTRAYGAISVRGGAQGGNGGFVETSGKRYLDAARAPDLAAPLGKGGTWLLDPTDITIVHSAAPAEINMTGGTPFQASPSTAGSSQLSDYTINQALSSGNVVITTASSGAASGDITFDASVSGAIVVSNPVSTARVIDIYADRDIKFVGGSTTFQSPPSTSVLDVGLNPTGKVTTSAGSSVTLDGNLGMTRAWLAPAKTWENYGTLSLTGNSAVHINHDSPPGSASTFHNMSGGTVNVASSGGWAFWSNACCQDGVIINDGTFNVSTSNTAFEAAYNQGAGGSLNVDGVTLNLQNAQNISGNINLKPGSFAGGIAVNEYHGVAANFSNVTFAPVGGTLYVGGTVGTPTANFSNVDAGSVALNIGNSGNPGIVNILGNSSFNLVNFNGGTLSTISNGILGVTNGSFTVPSGISYSGNIGFLVSGDLTINDVIATSGNMMMVAGWIPASGFSSPTVTAGTYSITITPLLAGSQAGLNATGSGNQTVMAGNAITVQGGNSGSNMQAFIQANTGTQTLSANTLRVYAGGSGAGYSNDSAMVTTNGSQVIDTQGANGGVDVRGGGASGGYNNYAQISAQGSSSSQTITLNGATSSVNVQGGAGNGTGGYIPSDCTGCSNLSSNDGWIGSKGSGGQKIDFRSTGGLVTVTGGTLGSKNSASIDTEGPQWIGGTSDGSTLVPANYPALTITGGATGGATFAGAGRSQPFNSAGITSDASQTIYASAITVSGGGGVATMGGAFLAAPSQVITTTGNVNVIGGASNAATSYFDATPAVIGYDTAADVTLNVGGNLTVQGGTGNYGTAAIGSLLGYAGVDASVQGSLAMTAGATSPALIGSLPGAGGSITLRSGLGGTGSMNLNTGIVGTGTSGSVTLDAQGTGGSISQAAAGSIVTSSLTSTSSQATSLGGTANQVDYYDGTASTGNLTFIHGATPVHVDASATGGNVTIQTGGDVGLGLLQAGGTIAVTAANSIFDDNGSGVANIVSGTGGASLTSTNGAVSPGYLAISADLDGSPYPISATVNNTASYGGVRLRWLNAAAPPSGVVTINDQSLTAGYGTIYYSSAGNISTSGLSATTTSGGISVAADGNLTVNGGTQSAPAGEGIALSAAGNLTVSSAFSKANPLVLYAGGSMNINAAVTSSGDAVALGAGTLNLNGATVSGQTGLGVIAGTTNINGAVSLTSPGGDVVLVTGTLNNNGGFITAPSGSVFIGADDVTFNSGAAATAGVDIEMLVTGDLRLNNGSYLDATNKVDLTLLGGTSTLYLNELSSMSPASKIMAGTGIDIFFAGRSSGGVTLDGLDSATTVSGGSGFYVPNGSTLAIKGTNLEIAYGVVDQTVINSLVSSIPKDSTDGTPEDNGLDFLPPASGGKGGLTGSGGQTIGGTEGSFGSTETEGGNGDKKDDKQDKSAQQDNSGKKQNDKSGGKKATECRI